MASSSSSMVQPASFRGYGRQKGLSGGLEGAEFTARCPPDVQKGTRIIAVCGIPEPDAAPQDDGWFFSDFFLFHQMLGSRPELPNQLWLSSCSPSDLIRKHERYLHGPPNGRRVVMNNEMLPKNEMAAGFRVFKPKDLLERFLATLESEIKEAARTKQPVLVLIFGHGQKQTSGILIGCGEGGRLKLTQERLASVLQKNVQTTMILTSCFSGGWVIMPNGNENFDVEPFFNHSFLTASRSYNESLSWPLSQTIGRQAGGSVLATCLLNSIITASDRTEAIYNREPGLLEEMSEEGHPTGVAVGKLIRVQRDDDGEELSVSMAGLTQQIVYECEAQSESLWTMHSFSFAAQDDLWGTAWEKRTGLPLLKYKEKWESLPEAPVKEEIYPTTGHLAGHLAGSLMSRSPSALHNIVKAKATQYIGSNPGPDNVGANTNCHPRFKRLIEGARFEFDDLYRINSILDYRQGQMRLAELYCYALEIDVPKDRRADKVDPYTLVHSQNLEKRSGSKDRSKIATEFLKRYNAIRDWIIQLQIFDSPLPHQGFDYIKPEMYLAARLAESSMPMEQIHKQLEDLLQCKLKEARAVACSPLGVAVLSKPEIKTMRGRLYGTVGKLKHKLRSLSPEKRSPRKEDRN